MMLCGTIISEIFSGSLLGNGINHIYSALGHNIHMDSSEGEQRLIPGKVRVSQFN